MCSDVFPSSHDAPAEGPKVLFWHRRRILVAGGNLADPNVLVPPRPALLEHEGLQSGLFRGLNSEHCGSFSPDLSQNDDILCRKQVIWRSEEITGAGRQRAVAFIAHKPALSCTNTGHSAPVLLRLLGHWCLDRLGTVWPRSPAGPEKDGSGEETGGDHALAAPPLLSEGIYRLRVLAQRQLGARLAAHGRRRRRCHPERPRDPRGLI